MKTSWNDKCALMGVMNHKESSFLTYLGLYAQQHRGQESAGIVSCLKGRHFQHRALGLVGDVFNESSLKNLKGDSAIGHTRYSTRGSDQDEKSIQPLTAQLKKGPLALAHNGNFVNFLELKKELKNVSFQGSGDTECLIHLISLYEKQYDSWENILSHSLSRVEGAYSLLLLTQDSLIAVRDPRGFRPLVLGKKSLSKKENPIGKNSDSYILASETCAFDLIGASFVREVEPGEMLIISKDGELKSHRLEKKQERKACVFEHIYFARPDSQVFGSSVYLSRKKMGRALARQNPVSADLVMPVPDSGVAAALGYAEESKIPFEMGIVRNHYIGRTFIHPAQSVRNFRVRIKLNPQSFLIQGRRIIVVDDSLVRGTTSREVVKILRSVGAGEIHFRIASPPVTGPCHYGVDTPRKSELISAKKSMNEIKDFLDVDSLDFLSVENLEKSFDSKGYCNACFTGNYPTAIPEEEC